MEGELAARAMERELAARAMETRSNGVREGLPNGGVLVCNGAGAIGVGSAKGKLAATNSVADNRGEAIGVDDSKGGLAAAAIERPPNGVRKSLFSGVLGKAKGKRRGKGGKLEELPKSRFLFEAESIYKEEDLPKSSLRFSFAEDGSISTVKPKRTKTVKVMVDKRLKYLLEKDPTRPLDLKAPSAEFVESIQRMIEWERDILEQFKTKGYAVYEREVEITDDEADDEASKD